MISKHLLYILVCASILFVSCNSSKQLTKKAFEYEQLKEYRKAADLFEQALRKKKDNIQAKNGLRKNGQLVLKDYLNDFDQNLKQNRREEAIYTYLKAEKYSKRLGSAGVFLSIPTEYQNSYGQIKKTTLNQWYQEANKHFDNKNYEDAAYLFDKILALDPRYKDVPSLFNIAQLEPLYIKGTNAMNQGNYRLAHQHFQLIQRQDANYKDSFIKMNEAIEFGKISVAILPFYNISRYRNPLNMMGAHVLSALANSPDPFIQVVDRENLDIVLQELDLAYQGYINPNTAIRFGELIGAKIAVTGKIINYHEGIGKTRRTKIQAYEYYKQKIKKADGDGYDYKEVTKPVSYTLHENENSIYMSVQYQVISLETGVVLASDIISETLTDRLVSARYNGNGRNLIPMENNEPCHKKAAINELQDLLSVNRLITPPRILSEDLQRDLAERIAIIVEKRSLTL